jgi:hypothetical protein
MKEEVVYTVAEYVALVCKIRKQWSSRGGYFDPWFRGHSDYRWKLEPKIFRIRLAGLEGAMRREFQRRSGHLPFEREPRNEWEWYFLMQHYGAPTRLLDWTDSALVGLFFAIAATDPGYPKPKYDAAVCVLDPWWLNRKVVRHDSILFSDFPEAQAYLPDADHEDENPLDQELPVAIDPPHIAKRVGLQHSHFTVYGRDRNGLSKLADVPGSRLITIRIPKDVIQHMRLDLNTCGLCDTAMFPDLDGLSRELTRFYADPWENELSRPPLRKTTNYGKRRSRR